MAYLRSSASDLGYVSTPMPSPITLPDGTVLSTFIPMAGVPNVRPVYSSHLPNNDSVVVKLGSACDVEHEVDISECLALKRHSYPMQLSSSQVSMMDRFTVGMAGLPQLLASAGALQCELAPGVTHFLVMSPMG